MYDALVVSGIVMAAAVFIGMGIIDALSARRALLEAQIEKHHGVAAPAPELAAVPASVNLTTGRGGRFPLLESLISQTNRGERMRKDLMQAGIRLRVGEYQGIGLGCAILGFAIGILTLGGLLAAMGGLFIGYLLPGLFVSLRKKRRLAMLNGQLVEMLELIATSLQSGFSFLQGLEAARQELPDPLSEELARTLREISFGASTEDALLNLGDRTEDADLRLAITAVLIQRRVGGNLAEVLTNISHTLRERIRIRGEIGTLTAQARGSGMIVGLLPVGLAVMLFFINPEYIVTLVEHPMGRLMLGAAVLLEIVGFFTIRKMIEVDF